jgi:hypothetical protein
MVMRKLASKVVFQILDLSGVTLSLIHISLIQQLWFVIAFCSRLCSEDRGPHGRTMGYISTHYVILRPYTSLLERCPILGPPPVPKGS